MPRRIGAPPVFAFTCAARSGPSTAQASAPSASSSAKSDSRRTTFTVRSPRAFARRMSSRPTAELATFWMTQSPGFEVDDVGQEQQRRRRIDAQHGGLAQVERGRHRDDVVGRHAPPLRPVLALQVDDEVARLHVRDAGADRGDAPDALGARRRGQRRLEAVRAAAERDVRRIDREEEDVEHDLARRRRADVGHLRAARTTSSGGPYRSMHHLLHRPATPSQNARSGSFGASRSAECSPSSIVGRRGGA